MWRLGSCTQRTTKPGFHTSSRCVPPSCATSMSAPELAHSGILTLYPFPSAAARQGIQCHLCRTQQCGRAGCTATYSESCIEAAIQPTPIRAAAVGPCLCGCAYHIIPPTVSISRDRPCLSSLPYRSEQQPRHSHNIPWLRYTVFSELFCPSWDLEYQLHLQNPAWRRNAVGRFLHLHNL